VRERSLGTGAGAHFGVEGGGPKRFSVQRKMAVVARLPRGEALQVVARETNINIARLGERRDRALADVGSHLDRDRKEVEVD